MLSGVSQPLRLSVLDQTPVSAGFTPTDALKNSLDLARHVDKLGFTRLWYAEHHANDLLACTAPEILIARAAAETTRIRVGSGGIMLSHYAPLKVAEVFRTLHAMFPGRIDLGIGRASGGGQMETYALRRNREVPQAEDFPQQLAELRSFLNPIRWVPNTETKEPHPFGRIRVAPHAAGAPDLWLLGSSMWSSVMASNEGLPYAFAHFFSGQNTRFAIEHYRRNFHASSYANDGRKTPEATIAIGVICAPTQDEAEHLHASVRLMQKRVREDDRRPVASPEDAVKELETKAQAASALPGFPGAAVDKLDGEFPRYVVGSPEAVRDQLLHIAAELELQELMVNTIVHSPRGEAAQLLVVGGGLRPELTPLTPDPNRRILGDAGWSSPVARWAHNPKVAGSNPAPATN